MAAAPAITPELVREFLREALPPDKMAAVERAARSDSKIANLIAAEREVMSRGDHSLGSMWQEHQLSCPTREQLGGFLMEAGDPDFLEYVSFHVTVIECSFCHANLEDLKSQAAAKRTKSAGTAKPRRKK